MNAEITPLGCGSNMTVLADANTDIVRFEGIPNRDLRRDMSRAVVKIGVCHMRPVVRRCRSRVAVIGWEAD